MRINLQVRPGATLTLDAENPRILVEQVASFAEVLTDTQCGCCGSENIRFDCREHDGNMYYGMRCLEVACGADLQFGSHKNMRTLYAKRQRGKNGWEVYQKRNGGGAQANPPADYDEDVPL